MPIECVNTIEIRVVDSAPMTHLLNCLIEAGASLSFGNFVSPGEPA